MLAAVELTATAEPRTVAVGAQTTYCIAVLADAVSGGRQPAVQVDTPVIGEGLVSSSARYETMRLAQGRFEYRCCWMLVADTPGTHTIAPVRVAVALPDGRQEVGEAPPVQVTVTAARSDQPHPVAPLRGDEPAPEPPPSTGRWALVLLGGTVVLSSLAAIGWLRNHESADAPAADSPEAALRAALETVMLSSGEPFWAALADALYTYAAAIGGRDGAGLTSAEALSLLVQAKVPVPLQRAVAAALRRADGVRFAREVAEPEAAAACLAELRAALGGMGKDR